MRRGTGMKLIFLLDDLIAANNELTQIHAFEKKDLPAITIPFPKEKEIKDPNSIPQLIKYKLNPKSDDMTKWNAVKAQYTQKNGKNSNKVLK